MQKRRMKTSKREKVIEEKVELDEEDGGQYVNEEEKGDNNDRGE